METLPFMIERTFKKNVCHPIVQTSDTRVVNCTYFSSILYDPQIYYELLKTRKKTTQHEYVLGVRYSDGDVQIIIGGSAHVKEEIDCACFRELKEETTLIFSSIQFMCGSNKKRSSKRNKLYNWFVANMSESCASEISAKNEESEGQNDPVNHVCCIVTGTFDDVKKTMKSMTQSVSPSDNIISVSAVRIDIALSVCKKAMDSQETLDLMKKTTVKINCNDVEKIEK
jgi:ADP-ribose pyrophosphatase YjhB (NUDIX family)